MTRRDGSTMTAEQQVRILSQIVTRNEAGKHFTEIWGWDELEELERAGLIEIDRPVHEATGIAYSQEYYSVTVTQDGIDLVEAHPEWHGPDEATAAEGFHRFDDRASAEEFARDNYASVVIRDGAHAVPTHNTHDAEGNPTKGGLDWALVRGWQLA